MTQAAAEAIIDEFEDAFESDDEIPHKKGSRLAKTYDSGTDESRALMDDIFITLCGYSFRTIRERSRGND